MDKYFIDSRVLPAIKAALDEDIGLGMYSGSFLASARSISRQLESTDRPTLTLEEGHFLQNYIKELVGREV